MTQTPEEPIVPEKRPVRRRAISASEAATPRRIVSSARRVAPVSKKIEEKTPVEAVASTPSRKAPTSLTVDKEVHSEKRKQLITIMVLLGIGIAASAGVGFLDKGQIDVQQTIEARNERIRNNQADERDMLVSQVEIPVQDTTAQGQVDGGLIGRGTGGKAPEPLAEVATTTATSSELMALSTEQMASSTEPVTEMVIPEIEEGVTEDSSE
jgi:hypothetical protein